MNDLLKQVAQPLDQSTRLVPLTQGQSAIVDAEDFERVVAMGKWYAAWSDFTQSFYAKRNGSRKNHGRVNVLPLHSVILRIPQGCMADHKNGNTLDYRKQNLRPCTQQQNQANRGPQGNSRSGLKGVHFHKQIRRWRAIIVVNKKRISLGCYGTPEEAGRAYDAAAITHFGEFAHLNFGLAGVSVSQKKKKR